MAVHAAGRAVVGVSHRFDRMRIERAVAAYNDALARLLGASTTGVVLIDVTLNLRCCEVSDESTERERQLTAAHG